MLESQAEVLPQQLEALGNVRVGIVAAPELQRDPAPKVVFPEDLCNPGVV